MVAKNISGVGHMALQLSDLEAGMRFFRDILGFKVKFETCFEGHRLVMLKAGKIELEMWEYSPNDNGGVVPEMVYGVHHIAVNVKDLDEVMAEMQSLGYKVLTGIYEPTRGLREAIIQGPDGIRVQFVEENVPVLIWRAVTGDFKNEAAR